MTKKKWVVVEDKEERVQAYMNAFANSEVPRTDDLHVLYFPTSPGRKLTDACVIPHGLAISHESVSSIDEFTQAVELLLAGNDPLVILLDVVLDAYNGKIQGCEDIQEYWSRIDKRICDDLVVMITLEEAIEDLLTRTGLSKVCLGVEKVSAVRPEVMIRQASAIIEGASREWASRYALPGKKLFHALMCAGSCGERKGHITSFEKSINKEYPQFPLREAFAGDTEKENSFKALFCYADKGRVLDDNYHCELGTMSRSILACGIPCCVDNKLSNHRGFLPVSPGAVFLVHFCRLVRLLDDPMFRNPVNKVILISQNDVWMMSLVFSKTILPLRTAYDNYDPNKSGATVKALKALMKCCLPIWPSDDATIVNTFDNAKKGIPKPKDEYVLFVAATMPLKVGESANVVDYNWDVPTRLLITPAVPKMNSDNKRG